MATRNLSGLMPQRAPVGRVALNLNHPLGFGLIGAWPLDASGIDLTGLSPPAVSSGSPGLFNGPRGPALSFNGSTSQYFTLAPSSPVMTKLFDFTISYWINTTSTAATSQLFTLQNNNPLIYFGIGTGYNGGAAGALYFLIRDNNAQISGPNQSAALVNDGNWHNIVVTLNTENTSGAVANLYIDGVPAGGPYGSSNGGVTVAGSGIVAQIGSQVTGFTGSVADLKIWNRYLSPGAVQALYVKPYDMFRPLLQRPFGAGVTSNALAGTAAVVTSASGALKGAGAAAGTAAVVTSGSGSLKGAGVLAGTAAVVTSGSGTLTNATVGSLWDSAYKNAGITLTNGGKTATSATSAGAQAVRSTSTKSSGLVFLEFTLNAVTNDIAVGIGNVSEGVSPGAGIGGDSNSAGFYAVSPAQTSYANGQQLNGGNTASVAGEVVSMAINFNTSPPTWYVTDSKMRAAGYTYNNSATANPATGVGGQSLTGLTGSVFYAFFNDDNGGAQCTVNFSGSFNQTVPSGYSSWDPLPAGAITGTAAIVTSGSGVLAGRGALAGTAAVVTSASGALKGAGALAGTAAIVTSGSGTLSGAAAGALAGSASIVTSASGVLTGGGALAGAANIVVSASGLLTAPVVLSPLAGSASIVVSGSGQLAPLQYVPGRNAGVLKVPVGKRRLMVPASPP